MRGHWNPGVAPAAPGPAECGARASGVSRFQARGYIGTGSPGRGAALISSRPRVQCKGDDNAKIRLPCASVVTCK
jgi:hypothetical protein